jgi:hypothetical protein
VVSLDGRGGKTPTAGAPVGLFVEHPPENSMASLSFTSTVLDEGVTFIFGSWICIANGLGGFNSHLVDSRKSEASTPTQHSDLMKVHLAP